MKTDAVMAIVAGGALFAAGCATKKHVTNTLEPVRSRLDQVAELTNRNATAIEENRKEIKAVDDRAENWISAISKATEAMNRTLEAAKAAADARALADKNASELKSLRSTVSSVDDHKLVAETTVQFAFGQEKLTTEMKEALDKLFAEKGNLKSFVVAVEGFTDQIGSAEYNNALSRRRANAVANYLVTKRDIPLYRIYTAGLGSEKPAEEGKTRAARSKNRRVEVRVFSMDQTTALTPDRAQ